MKTCLILCLAICESAVALITPPEWNFGMQSTHTVLTQDVEIVNDTAILLKIAFISTCACLESKPEEIEIPAGQSRTLRLSFDPRGYSGAIDKVFMVRSNNAALNNALYRVRGTLIPEETTRDQESEGCRTCQEIERTARRTGNRPRIQADYYYSPGCRRCTLFLEREIPALEKKLVITILLRSRDILDPDIYGEYLERLNSLGEKARAFPAIILGPKVLQGEREILENIEEEILKAVSEGQGQEAARTAEAGAGDGTSDPASGIGAALTPLSIIAAGLLDGINPCAFTTLLFLLSYLTLAGRSKRDLLLIGVLFSLSIFATYFLIGFGLFRALRLAALFPVIAGALKWGLVAVLLIFAVLSFYDAYLVRAGRPADIILQLPSALKKQIRKTIRTRVRTTALAGSTLTLGFLVSVFELACTGQVYFPTLVYMVRIEARIRSLLLLVLYNTAFIIPLAGVFILVYSGISSTKLTRIFQTNMGRVKIGSGLLFIMLAALSFFNR